MDNSILLFHGLLFIMPFTTYGTLCSQDYCTSYANDCWAASGEPCTCSQGTAATTGESGVYEGVTIYEYTCCESQKDAINGGYDFIGEECASCDYSIGFFSCDSHCVTFNVCTIKIMVGLVAMVIALSIIISSNRNAKRLDYNFVATIPSDPSLEHTTLRYDTKPLDGVSQYNLKSSICL